MYNGEVEIISWPMINDTTWFKPLLNVSKKLVMQKAKYENARTFLQNTKVIMAKLKVCKYCVLWKCFYFNEDKNLISYICNSRYVTGVH